MSAIPFTNRELTRAMRELEAVATPPTESARKNPHRLLLFYAVECGLKAVWLRRQRRDVFDSVDITKTGHNLRQVLKELNVGAHLALPESFQLEKPVRRAQFGDIHQAWRYGGKCFSPTDEDCEKQLLKVLSWIQGELK